MILLYIYLPCFLIRQNVRIRLYLYLLSPMTLVNVILIRQAQVVLRFSLFVYFLQARYDLG